MKSQQHEPDLQTSVSPLMDYYNLQGSIDLGFGGIGCDLYQFEILWHASGADIAKRLTTNAKLRDNPRTALTAEDIDLGPTQLQTPRHGMRTRIHAPASPAPSYRTEESIGAGAFGQVFRVHDLNNGAKMALKVLRAPPMDTAQYTDWYQNLKREVETLSRVKHENIISIIGTENLNTNQPRLFMPLMDGTLESLAAKRECAGYEKDLCNRMTHHMLQALDYLQIHNIIHRDIKPANILYKRTEGAGYRFVLGDFGLCNNTVLAETRGKGTPLFMAPEVFDSTAGGYMQSARSDMWSLFVTIIWTLNLNDFRRAAASLTGSCHSRTAMEKCWRLVWATSHKIPAWQPMCEVDPERRPSAAELLFRHFEGKGLLTPQRRIPWVKVSPPAEEARGKPSTEAEGPAYALGSVVLCLSGALVGLLAASAASADAEPCLSQQCKQNALAFAYQYGYPLYALGEILQPYGETVETNRLHHQEQLAAPGAIGVVRPNVDTVYSLLFVDLSKSDLVFDVPAFDGRYWSQSFFDLYANNVANIGNLGKDKPGKYLVRYTPDNFGVQREGVQGGFKAYINVPTPYGITITRILVRGATGDMEKVHGFQKKLVVSERPRFDSSTIPPFNLSLFRDPAYRPGKTPLEVAILRLTAALATHNQPYVVQDRTWVAALLANAGIAHGRFAQPRGTNLTAATAVANASVAALRATPGFVQDLGNSWTLTQPTGLYGSFYQARYLIGSRGYLAITKEQVLYPSTPTLELGANQSYVIRFSRRPKTVDGGFWSLTAYGSDQFLIPNPIKRYALGDRSNLTFPDGRPLAQGADGPFDILVQPGDVRPPSNWTNK
ncbi:monooxygenase [Purpureocillium lavendulum]|uniref:mitogen-activated protein kinase n=1 Tax=Purpureocillium lavendulum TaxID=1247861 RepID=A0AB34FUH8_9HYPO|nr:monooxygenase [Purpureocillium lavendulum]